MRLGKRILSLLCVSGVTLGICGVTPAHAQKKSVAEELIEILQADGKISKDKADELRQRAKVENEARDAGVEAFRRDPVKAIKAERDFDWLNRFSFFGDMRARVDGIYQADGPNGNARTRERFRLRFGTRVKVSDEIEGGLRLVSGDPGDPISANQTLTDLFTKKPISLDQAWITITPKSSFSFLRDFEWNPLVITAGKFANPLFRPRLAGFGSEMVWDDDLTPEGLNETLTFFSATEGVLRRMQLHAAQWTVKEAARSADAWMFGAQLVGNFQLLPMLNMTIGAGEYSFVKPDLLAKERNTNGSLKLTNSVVLNDGTVIPGGLSISPSKRDAKGNLIPIRRFLSDWNIFNASAQFDINTGYAQWPLGLFIDYAHNLDAAGDRNNNAYWAGASLGVLKNPGDFAFSAVWARQETESVLSMFSYSDFGRDGGTNVQGPILKVDYLLLPRLTLSAKNHFVSFIDRPQGQSNETVNRLLLDAVLSF
jgi:hypothetical protein